MHRLLLRQRPSSGGGSSNKHILAAAAGAAAAGAAAAAAIATTTTLPFTTHQETNDDDNPTPHPSLSPFHLPLLPPFFLPFLHPTPTHCFFRKKNIEEEATLTSSLSSSSALFNPAPFDSIYKLGPALGSGAFATVHKCISRSTRKLAAVKVFDMNKAPVPEQRAKLKAGVVEEVAILRSLKHERIVQVYDLFEDPKKLYFVMELCTGGELFDRIVEKQTYTEKEARDVIKTLLSILAYCHEAQVVHRDLKPENLLLESEDCDLKIKLADFGAAAKLAKPDSLVRYVGTPGYSAPEMLSGKNYGLPVDIWSAGIIAYILLGGYPPFADNEDQIEKKAIFQFHSPEWDDVSDEGKDLISGLLIIDPKKRLTAKQALSHKWFLAEDAELEGRSLESAKKGIESFNARRKFRAAIKGVMAMNRMKRLLTPGNDK